MYSYGPPHIAVQKQDDQHEHTFSSYVRIRDVVLKACLGRWTIGRSGERGSRDIRATSATWWWWWYPLLIHFFLSLLSLFNNPHILLSFFLSFFLSFLPSFFLLLSFLSSLFYYFIFLLISSAFSYFLSRFIHSFWNVSLIFSCPLFMSLRKVTKIKAQKVSNIFHDYSSWVPFAVWISVDGFFE